MTLKVLSFSFFLLLFLDASKVWAQDEVYEPAQVMDTLPNTSGASKSEKEKKQKEDAKTELERKKERLQRLRIGPNLGFQFGTFTYVNVSPTVGYMVIKDRLELGGGPILIYERYKFSPTDKISFFVYGSDVYARGYLWRGLYLESRYDLANKPSYYDLNHRIFVHHLLLGAGYASPIGKVGSFYISALFNVLNNKESIYKGTFGNFPLILNFGFGFGIGGRK